MKEYVSRWLREFFLKFVQRHRQPQSRLRVSEAERRELHERLSTSLCPSSFRKATHQGTLYRWVRPEVVVEIKCNDLIASDTV